MKPNTFAPGTVTIMDATGKVIDHVAPEQFWRRQAQEKRRPFKKVSRMAPEDRQRIAKKASWARWGKTEE